VVHEDVRVHHLNCTTICPPLGPLRRFLVNERGELVCHCLLIETSRGLVLVDTGFSERDLSEPRRLPGSLRASIVADPDRSAVRQVRRLGFQPKDVTDVIVTHLDLDHAGGLVDFPEARVHIYAREHRAAMARESLYEKLRYLHAHYEGAERYGWHGGLQVDICRFWIENGVFVTSAPDHAETLGGRLREEHILPSIELLFDGVRLRTFRDPAAYLKVRYATEPLQSERNVPVEARYPHEGAVRLGASAADRARYPRLYKGQS